MKSIAVLLLLALLGAPLFVIVGTVSGVAFLDYAPALGLSTVLDPFAELLANKQFLAIPLFIGAGQLMTEGGMARRLVDFMRALLCWLPGGLGMAAVFACMGFAAISGSSPVTLIAVGSIMVPAMVKAKYDENFSMGLVMTAGSLGCLVIPSLILMIYSLAVSSSNASVQASDMFVASAVPAGIIAVVLCVYSAWSNRHVAREEFAWRQVAAAGKEGIWALMLPILVFLGIIMGFFAPFKAGAFAFVYALIVTTLVHRELDMRKVFKVLADASRLMGMLILIIGLTFGVNKLIVEVGADEIIASWVEPLGPVAFMLLVNVLLIVLGALMDSVSATLLFAPILAPIAMAKGIDPIHFGIVFVVNMEIGYLAPPVATNLFVASALFKKPFGQVSRAVLPGLAITVISLLAFIFVPTLSKGVLNAKRGDGIWEPFPWDGQPYRNKHPEDAPKSLEDIGDKLGDVKSDELNKQDDDDYYFDKADAGAGEANPDAPAAPMQPTNAAPAGEAPPDLTNVQL